MTLWRIVIRHLMIRYFNDYSIKASDIVLIILYYNNSMSCYTCIKTFDNKIFLWHYHIWYYGVLYYNIRDDDVLWRIMCTVLCTGWRWRGSRCCRAIFTTHSRAVPLLLAGIWQLLLLLDLGTNNLVWSHGNYLGTHVLE